MLKQRALPGVADETGWPRSAGRSFFGRGDGSVSCSTRQPSPARAVGLGLRLGLAAVQKDFPSPCAEVNSKLSLFCLSCGLDDGLIKSNREFKELMKSKDVHFVDVETPGYVQACL